jgi:hypothetical protein
MQENIRENENLDEEEIENPLEESLMENTESLILKQHFED